MNIAGLGIRIGAWRHRTLVGKSYAAFSRCERYRYWLAREWDETKPCVVFVGLNPSKADESVDDPTIRRILGFAHAWACGSLLMLNAFAFRSTDPKGLLSVDDPIGPDNDSILTACFAQADRLVLGWGAHGEIRRRGGFVASMALSGHARPESFGLTKNGHPLHPLYLPADAKTFAFADLIAARSSP